MGRVAGRSYIYCYPYISHIMKYNIGWESNWKKHLYYVKSTSTNSPGSSDAMGLEDFPMDFSHSMGFPDFSMRKPMHFPYDEVYHRIGI